MSEPHAAPLEELGQRLEELRAATSDAPQPLDALAAARGMEDGLLSLYDALVLEAREAGATWKEIGAAMGVSMQAAAQRFKDYVAAEQSSTYQPGPKPPQAPAGAQRMDRRGRRR